MRKEYEFYKKQEGKGMKKTLLFTMTGLMAIGSASAIPTPDAARENCIKLEQEGTHIWVEKNQSCILRNPCKTENVKEDFLYCDHTFKNYTANSIQWKPLVNAYAKTHNLDCEATAIIEGNYVLCSGQDTKVFEFSYINEMESDYDSKVFELIVCRNILNGEAERDKDYDGLFCRKSSESDCKAVNDVLSTTPKLETVAIWNKYDGYCIIASGMSADAY